MRPQAASTASAGLTLIELVVAMAVFALIAVMGLQGLAGALRIQEDLTARAGRATGLVQATALLRNDLAVVAPLVFLPPAPGAPQAALGELPGGGFALSVAGLPQLAGLAADDPGLRRAEWRFEAATGRLTRRLWPTLYPVDAGQAGPEVTVLEGLRRLAFRSFWPGEGWRPGLVDTAPLREPPSASDGDGPGSGPALYAGTLPRAVEITLDTETWGEIILVEFLQ